MQEAIRAHAQGRFATAQGIYAEILKIQPRHFQALHLLGRSYGQSGHFDKAADFLGKAVGVNPHDAVAHTDRGTALKALRRFDEALASFDKALDLDPRYAVAHSNRGNLLKELGRIDAALASYDRAIVADPRCVDAHFNRAVLLGDVRQWEAALAGYDAVIALRANHAEAYCNRGVVLERLNHWDAALASYDRALSIKPDFVLALSNRGNTLCELGRVDEALDSCDRALAIKPDFADGHCNRGVALQRQRQIAAALASYEQAIALSPDNARAHFNRSMALLLLGDFDNGWAAYEWRWRQAQTSPSIIDGQTIGEPRWLGQEPLSGKTILLWEEQGLGDTLQFCRYARHVADLGATVLLKVAPSLVRLLRGLEGVAALVPAGSPLPKFDYHSPLMSLPLALKTSPLALTTSHSTVPGAVPYLTADPVAVGRWRDQLGERRGLRVGLVWSGGFRPDQPEVWSVNARRNIPLAKLAPLSHPDIEFFSLQKGQAAESELAELVATSWAGPKMRDFTASLEDFSDTAALLAHLDLVISVDTSTAHLAGALGRPVWILNRFDACWRWTLDRADSPWYPSARIYRQVKPGDWDELIQRVRNDLFEVAASPAARSSWALVAPDDARGAAHVRG